MNKKNNSSIFDPRWLIEASSRKGGDQWVDDAIADIDGSGGIYLNILRRWFSEFPLTDKQKKHLRRALGSFENTDHLGAVNEIAWWKFTNSFGWSSKPIDAGKDKKPDFHVQAPYNFFCEVTTLNLAKKDMDLLKSKTAVNLDHERTLQRILTKIVKEKAEQIKYGASKKSPSILVLFDYTFWSGFGTKTYQTLADFLFDYSKCFMKLPPELTAIIYVEKKVFEGQIGISKERSAVYHNPNAIFSLPETVFQMMRQYLLSVNEILPNQKQINSEYWFWL